MRLLFSILVLLFAQFLQAQSRIDSLSADLKKAETDSQKVLSIILLGQEWATIEPDSSIALYHKARQMAETNGFAMGYSRAAHWLTDLYTDLGLYDRIIAEVPAHRHWIAEYGIKENALRLATKIGYAYQVMGMTDSALVYYDQILEDSETGDLAPMIIVDILRARAEVYSDRAMFSKAVKDIVTAQRLADTTDLRSMYTIHSVAASIYLTIGDRELGLRNLNEAYRVAKRSKDFYFIGNALYYLAEYFKAEDPQQAIFYAKQGERLFQQNNMPYGILMLRAILGSIYFEQERLDEADSCFSYVVETGAKYGLEEEIAIAQSQLGQIQLKRKDYGAALAQCTDAWRYLEVTAIHSHKRSACACLAEAYTELGDDASALAFRNKQILYAYSARNELDLKETYKTQYRYEMEQLEVEAARLESERNRQLLTRNILIALMVLVLIGLVWLFNRHRKKLHQRQQVILGEKKMAEDALRAASQRLDEIVSNMQLKNLELEQTRQELETLKDEAPDRMKEQKLRLEAAVILTDQDWRNFMELFEVVNPGFLQRLNEQYPELTLSQVRFFVLCRLERSNKEMAAMLGVTTDAIRQMRSRLRKQLSLSSDETIMALALAI